MTRSTARAQQVLRTLFAAYAQDATLLPAEHRQACEQLGLRAVADYIAGMTDRFAAREFERLTGERAFDDRAQMARLPRLAVAGALHHVLQRGHDGQAIVRDDADRERLLGLLRDAAVAERVAVHAYALLDDALHLLVTPSTAAALGRWMQAVGRSYVRSFNLRHGRSGTLWDGRFRSSVIEPGLLLEAMIHVEGLGRSAGVAAEPAAWTSAAHHLGRRRDPLVSDHPAYWALGNTPFERELAHADKLAAGLSPSLAARFDGALRSGHAVGSVPFVREVEGIAGRPAQARSRGRPASRGRSN